MEWLESIFEVCIIPLLGLLTAYAIKWLKAKEVQILDQVDSDMGDKYIALLFETIRDCVSATSQTYVDSLKEQGAFNEQAQKIAFDKTLEAVLSVLSDDAKGYLSTIYGDLTVYIGTKIEAEVKAQKK